MWRSSLRTKILVGCSVAILGSAVSTYFTFSRVAEQYAVGGVEGRANALAKNTAFVAAPLIAFDSRGELKKAVDLLQADSDFVSAEVEDAEGRVVASSRRKAPGAKSERAESEAYVARAQAIDNGKLWGSVTLTVSLSRMRRELQFTCRAALVLSLLLGVIALAAVYWFIHKVVLTPLSHLQSAATTIAKGEFPCPVQLSSPDELGQLTGQFNRMVVALRDASRVERLVRDLEEKTRQAEAGSRAKSEFMATISHEIRTPMNGVMGMTELALETELTEEQRGYLTTVQLSAEGLLTIINQILDFSKIEAGKLELNEVAFNLREYLWATLKTVSLPGEQKGLELACDIDPELPDSLIGDPERLRQIIVNLIGNAIKFTDRGEVVLRVVEDSRDTDHITLHFSVSDTGIGISPEKQELIFQAFTQADGSTTRKYGGTGLGLTISWQLIELMGGRIWVESQLGAGSSFHFVVTLGISVTQASAINTTTRLTLAGGRVLIIDDNLTSRTILDRMLKNWGMRPTLAADAASALFEIESVQKSADPFKLILLEVELTDVDGSGLCKRLGDDPDLSELTIMMLSSSGNSKRGPVCHPSGKAVSITKPVRENELRIAAIHAVSGGNQRQIGVEESAAAPQLSEGRNRLHVLLAEDNVINQRLGLSVLRKDGHSVVLARNGREVLTALESDEFDLILMDIQMPEISGLEATELIRAQEKVTGGHIPIVALTAGALKGDRELCLAAGMDGYLSKPFSLAGLRDAISATAFQTESEVVVLRT